MKFKIYNYFCTASQKSIILGTASQKSSKYMETRSCLDKKNKSHKKQELHVSDTVICIYRTRFR